MESTELVHCVILAASIFGGLLVRKAHGELKRHLCLIFGFCAAILYCGPDIWHAFALIGGLVLFFSLISARFAFLKVVQII